MPMRRLLTSFAIVVTALSPAVDASVQKLTLASVSDLTELSLEELMEVEVTSVSRKKQMLSEAAAAVYVISQEDIRRSGATSIPEVLRLVPGLQVARINSNKWAVTSRGFNGLFANKLLVLIDGRSVYTPLFAGVRWDAQDTLLEDVERIEVIRGPGGTLWGANAVNGVINIITKSAKRTQGALVSGGGGDQERGFGAVRYGGALGRGAYMRLYARYFDRDDFEDALGGDAGDRWKMYRGGFRMDWDVSGRDALTLQGDVYDGEAGQSISLPSLSPPSVVAVEEDFDTSGGNVLTRWGWTFSDSSDLALQLYYDHTRRTDLNLVERRDTYDVDFQHRFPLPGGQEVVWGLGYRYTRDRTEGTFAVSFDPGRRSDELWSAFVQDEMHFLDDRLRIILGSKFEENDYAGFEAQPNARVLWKPARDHTLWAAVSRAVRTPSRSDTDIRINFDIFAVPGAPPTLLSIFGSDIESEDLLAYEIGYRGEPSERLSVDMAAFFNIYKHLVTREPGVPFVETDPPPAHMVQPFTFDNKMDGETFGAEAALKLRVTEAWRLIAGYSWLKMDLSLDGSSGDTVSLSAEGSSPRHQFNVRSHLDLPRKVEFDAALYYVDDLPAQGVPDYTRVDARLGWRPTDGLELSLALQNIFDKRHPEFVSVVSGLSSCEAPRSVYGKITWEF